MNYVDGLATDFGKLFLRFHRLVDRRMAAEGASFARTKLLLYLQRNGASRAADIADLLGSAPRTITEAIDGLERDGLVRRAPHATDRRAKLITITDDGMRVLKATEPLRSRLVDEIFGVLDPDERDRLSAMLAKLATALDAAEH